MGGDTGHGGFLLRDVRSITLGGIFIISTLIGILNNGLQASSPSCARAGHASSSATTP